MSGFLLSFVVIMVVVVVVEGVDFSSGHGCGGSGSNCGYGKDFGG